MKDVYQVKETTENNDSLDIVYTRPKFMHRILANLVDIFIFIVLTFSLFLGARGIIQNVPYYKGVQNRIFEMQLESGIFWTAYDKDGKGTIVSMSKYLDNYFGESYPYGKEVDHKYTNADKEYEPVGKNGWAVRAINTFLAFSEKNSNPERHQELLQYYDSYRLEARLNDAPLFIKDGDNIVANQEVLGVGTNWKEYSNKVFIPFIDDRCMAYLASNVTEYKKLNRIDFNFLIFLEIPLAYSLAAFLTFFVPPLFFRRGRQTLGKALYHIGLIDSRILSPTFPRFLARFAIFFFGELVLSLFSFGLPYIISFSLMVFSKNKQGFPDYMLRLYEVDTSKANIYLNYVEAQLKNELHGEAVDFKMEKPL